MRTGTRTVVAPPLSTSAPATICGRCCRTASRTLSLWRSQSRAPRENKSYQPCSPGLLPPPPEPPPPDVLSLMCCVATSSDFIVESDQGPFDARPLLLRQQCRDVAERFLSAVLVVTILRREAVLHRRNFLTRLVVRPRRGSHQPQYIAALLEQVLLDRLAHARVAVEGELLAGLVRDHGLAHDLLAKSHLARLRHLDLVLDRAQEPLVGGTRLAGDRIGDLAMVERGLHFIQVLVQQLLRFVLERREQRAVHVFLDPAVVEVLARQHQVVDPELLRLGVHAGVVLDRIFEREQHFHAGQALLVAARDRIGDRVDDEAWADAGQALFG